MEQDKQILTLTPSEQCQRLLALFNQKKLDIFVEQCELLISAKIDLSQLSHQNKTSIDISKKYIQMKRILTQSIKMLQIANCAVSSDWHSTKIDAHCTISLKTQQTTLHLKSSGLLKTNIKHILCVAYLIKLYNKCLPFCKQSRDVKQVSALQKVGFVRLSIPIPFIKDRCAFIMGIGFDRVDRNGTVVIYAQGLADKQEFIKLNGIQMEEEMKGRQLLDLKHFAVELRCRGNQLTQYSACAVVDHHMPLLPRKLVEFVVKEIAKFLYQDLMQKMLDFKNTVWAKQIQHNYGENQHFYDWINTKIQVWEEKLNKQKNKPKI